jgi:uncharacterized protein YdeI (YjbR/CyaY-like superfamily)
MSTLDRLERFYARNREEWREWLEKNHQSSPGIWFIYYKKGTNVPTVAYEDAVGEALSFGWIDSKVNALDEERYMQVFTPRKPGSTWSRINKQRVEKLIKEGLMTTSGMQKIEVAKKDGSWSILDDVEDLLLPEDLKKEFRGNEQAEKYFHTFKDSSKKQILWWIASAKRPETRKRRIEKVVELAAKNKTPF